MSAGGGMTCGCSLGRGDKFGRMSTHRCIVDIGVALILIQFPLN